MVHEKKNLMGEKILGYHKPQAIFSLSVFQDAIKALNRLITIAIQEHNKQWQFIITGD